jgi:membrane fusion protein (multidrug efflux system)
MKSNLLYILLLLGFFCCHSGERKQRKAPPAVPVNTTTVQEQQLIYYDTYPAVLVALKEVELRSEVGGEITGISFKEGQPVKKGQKLYEIDRRVYEANYNQAKASLNIAEQNMEKSQRDANRYIALSKEDAIAKQQLDNALTDLQNAKSQVSAAQANLEKARTDLNYSIITAPFEGTIGISQVRMGALVTPDQTLLNVISSDDPMGADIQIEQKELGRIQMLEKSTPAPGDSIFRLILPNNSVYDHYGKISIIDRNVDPRTGTIRVRLSFPNPQNLLRPGMNCNAQVLNQNSGKQIVIPYKAVLEQMSEYFVYRIDSMKAKQTKVSLGPKIDGNVIVKQGLKPGDQIVTEGIQRLHDGAPVQLGQPTEGANPQGSKPPVKAAVQPQSPNQQ